MTDRSSNSELKPASELSLRAALSDPVSQALVASSQGKDRPATSNTEPDESALGLLKLAAKSAFISGVQNPLDGITQLAGKAIGTDVHGPHFIDAPRQAQFGSKAWYAETFGSGVGMIGSFLLTEKVSGAALSRTRYAGAMGLTEGASASFGGAIAKSTIDGGLYGFVFTPSESNGANFWKDRAVSAAAGGLTFGTQAGLSRTFLAGTERLGLRMSDAAFANSMGGYATRISMNALAGGFAGGVSAESNSLLSGHGLASKDQLENSIGQFVVTGGALDLAHIAMQRAGAPGSQTHSESQHNSLPNSDLPAVARAASPNAIGFRDSASDVPLAEARASRTLPDRPYERVDALNETPALRTTLKSIETTVTDLSGGTEKVASFSRLIDNVLARRSEVSNPAEIDSALKNVDEIMKGKLVVDLSPEQRVALGKQLLYEVAAPDTVAQGTDYTCGPLVVEKLALMTSPSKQLEAIKSLLTTGKFETSGEKPATVDLSPETLSKLPQQYRNALLPDFQARRSLDAAAQFDAAPVLDGERSYASQLAQLINGNIFSQALAPEGEKAIYVNGPADRANPADTGERLFDMQTFRPVTDKSGAPLIGANMESRDLQPIWEHLTGEDTIQNDFVLMNTNEPVAQGEGRFVLSPRQLEETILSSNRPQILEVDPNHPVFGNHIANQAEQTGQPSRHVILVEPTVNPRTGNPFNRDGEPLFNVIDSYGSDHNFMERRGLTATQLFEATRHPGEAISIKPSESLPGVQNFGVVDEAGFFRSRKPDSLEGIQSLKDRGVTLIINLIEGPSTDQSGKDQEQAWVQQVGGMRYLNMKTSVKNFNEENIRSVFQEIENEIHPTDGRPPGKVVLHCARGVDRTGTISAIWRLTHQPGWTVDLAQIEMRQFGHNGNTPSTRRMAEFVPKFSMFGEAPKETVTSAPESRVIGYGGAAADHMADSVVNLLDQPIVQENPTLQKSAENVFDHLGSHGTDPVQPAIAAVFDRTAQLVQSGELKPAEAQAIFGAVAGALESSDNQAKQRLFSKIEDPSSVSKMSATELQKVLLDGVKADRVAARIEKFQQLEPRINSVRDHQSYVQNVLKMELASMKRHGSVPPTWEVFPTQAGSPADLIGADYILVDRATGEYHLMDATSNSDKFAEPSRHNVPKIGEQGLVYYEKPYFDAMGMLRTDPDEPFAISQGVQNFTADISQRLQNLTHSRSPLNLIDVPLPSITAVEPAIAQQQVKAYSDALSARSQAIPNAADQQQLREFAKLLERGANNYLDKSQREVTSHDFRSTITKYADRAIVTYAISKMLGREFTVQQPKEALNDSSYHAKKQSVKMEVNGTIYDSGDIRAILKDARGDTLRNLESLITDGQMKALRKAMPGQSDQRIQALVASKITNMANEISAGGAVGTGRPILIDYIVARLRSAQPDAILGK